MREAFVRVGGYECGSIKLVVAAKAVEIRDMRQTVDQMYEQHSGIPSDESQPAADADDPQPSTPNSSTPHLDPHTHPPNHMTPHVPHATIINIPFAATSSMESVMQQVVARAAEDTDTLFPLNEVLADPYSPTRAPSGLMRHPNLGTGPQGTASAESIQRIQRILNRQATADYLVWGFSLNHLMQAFGPDKLGPHVIEIVLEGANLAWPYLADMDLIWDIQAVYSDYMFRPYVVRNPPCSGPDRWMYVNVVLKRS